MANRYMDIMKWKKIASDAKKSQKYLSKVMNWDESDKDYNDDVSIQDAWEWGTDWIDSWYDVVVENGLYELGDKKVHILYKSPKLYVGGEIDIDNRDKIIDGLTEWGYSDNRFIQIDRDTNYGTLHSHHLEWFVVAVVDGRKKLIIPHLMGDLIPTDGNWYEWNGIAEGGDYIDEDSVVDFDGEKVMNEETYEYDNYNDTECLSYKYVSDYDAMGYDIRWANMRRIA